MTAPLGSRISHAVSYSRRRERPYVDGYGTPAFVDRERSGGGPVIDVGTYTIGQLLYLLGNPTVERVAGATFDHSEDALAAELTGDNHGTYADRREAYSVEDVGFGFARLAGNALLSLRAAWHLPLPDAPSAITGSQGGLRLDPLEYYTTMADYETTTTIEVEEYE